MTALKKIDLMQIRLSEPANAFIYNLDQLNMVLIPGAIFHGQRDRVSLTHRAFTSDQSQESANGKKPININMFGRFLKRVWMWVFNLFSITSPIGC